jgi:hypothetical protein
LIPIVAVFSRTVCVVGSWWRVVLCRSEVK